MRLLRSLSPRRLALRAPGRTIRLRLTLLYAGLFLASGTGLLAVTYVLVRHATDGVLVATHKNGTSFFINNKQKAPMGANFSVGGTAAGISKTTSLTGPFSIAKPLSEKQALAQIRRDTALAKRQHEAEMHQLLEQSGIALALMAAISIALGWLAAGRVLRPLRIINQRAREISASNLHKRLALAGPDDEVKQLANTFDELLGRLEASFSAQRQFVANASHELRTPLARARTLTEVALGDPAATVASLRATHERVLAAGEQQERLIEALLTLARSERGLDERGPFDLADVTAAVLQARRDDAGRHAVELRAALAPTTASGNAPLAERLVANLVDNAVRHNRRHGHVEVTTRTSESGHAVLAVSNSGPRVPEREVERLFQPFQRLGADRTDHSDGIGLGLSIVAAIAAAHGAELTARAQPEGGLAIEIAFPPPVVAGGPAVAPEPRRRLASASRLLGLGRRQPRPVG